MTNTTKAGFANPADPDETAHNELSHLDLQCLPSSLCIMQTNPCNVHPLTPHFYIVKLGFTGVYIIFLFLL